MTGKSLYSGNVYEVGVARDAKEAKELAAKSEATVQQLQGAIADLQAKVQKLSAEAGGINKGTAEAIFDGAKAAIAKLRTEVTDIHRDTLTEIRTSNKALVAMAEVNFDAAVALIKSAAIEFVGVSK